MTITSEQIQCFKDNGIVVIENVLSDTEILEIRHQLHNQLTKIGINHDNIMNGSSEPPPEVRIKSPVAKIFYPKWKIDLATNPKIYYPFKELINATFASGIEPGFTHPFRKITDLLTMIERVGWRLPDHIRAEGGLGLHLDRNPTDPFLKQSNKGLTKWRPIQAFITLTDHYGGASGGLKVVKGFHHKIEQYFNNVTTNDSGNGGEFYRMINSSLNKELSPIDAPAGSLVCWDNRLPHSTCQQLISYDSREVIYIGWLPDVPVNLKYISDQVLAIKNNKQPPAFLDNPNEICDKDWKDEDLTEWQKKLLGFNL